MNIYLNEILLNEKAIVSSSFIIKLNRLSQINYAIAKHNALVRDCKNISFNISFAIEKVFSSNFKANEYAFEHCSFLSNLTNFSLKIEESNPEKQKKYSTLFNDVSLNNFTFNITNNSTVFNYTFTAPTIEYNNGR